MIDSTGHVAVVRHSGAGIFGGQAAGGAIQYQYTSAPTVDDLAGFSVSKGGPVGYVPELTGELIAMPNGHWGVNIGIGASVGPLPFETHTMVEVSEITWKKHIVDILKDWIFGETVPSSNIQCQ